MCGKKVGTSVLKIMQLCILQSADLLSQLSVFIEQCGELEFCHTKTYECSALFQHSTFSSRCICKYGYLVEKLEYFSLSNIISSISYLSSFLFSSIQCQFICPVRLRLRVVSACNYHKKNLSNINHRRVL